ncbi:MAG: hydrogenase maturation nickel metallochaperone HypA [Pirellula sp.]|jgi:hydrogenase nickel incorporation protein HypA/HybF
MHETSIAATIWDQISAVEKSNAGYEAKRVEIDVGTFSGVEQVLLADALVLVAKQHERVDVDIVLHEVPLLARCEDCLADFMITDFQFRCIQCGEQNLRMIDGDSIRLMHLDLQLIEQKINK